MSNDLKDLLNDIPIPEEIDKSIELGFRKAKKELMIRKIKNTFITIAASLAVAISITGLIGFDKVEAAIKRTLQYIPGYNILVDAKEGEALALKDKVRYEKDGIYVTIYAASKYDEKLDISVESNFEKIDDIDVLLKDKFGNIIPLKSCGIAGGGDFWEGDFNFEVGDEYNSYTLLLGDIEIPFTLEKTQEIDDFTQLGNYASDKGISIIAIKKPQKDNLMISLLHQTEGIIIEDYPFEQNLWLCKMQDFEKSMYITDKDGNKIYPSIPSSFGSLMSNFYFDIHDQEGLKLVLPYVKVTYPDVKTEKIKIRTPVEGEIESINQELAFGKFNIQVIDAKRENENIIVSFKINSPEDEIIDYLRVEGISGYSLGPNEETGIMELSIDKEDAGKEFSIQFTSPTAALLGDWTIELD